MPPEEGGQSSSASTNTTGGGSAGGAPAQGGTDGSGDIAFQYMGAWPNRMGNPEGVRQYPIWLGDYDVCLTAARIPGEKLDLPKWSFSSVGKGVVELTWIGRASNLMLARGAYQTVHAGFGSGGRDYIGWGNFSTRDYPCREF